MTYTKSLTGLSAKDLNDVGGKAVGLARLANLGFSVPNTLCITTSAYNTFLSHNGLQEKLLLVLHRKSFRDMRWEEIWDASLRIRNLFLTTPFPSRLIADLARDVGNIFKNRPTVVRSSAPAEDAAKASFAGLHASYVNILGTDEIIAHIRKVWASLWSDAALLYRQELGLSVEKSTMAVVIQELVKGECSGVFFTQNPMDRTQAVLEAVYGLNQGLVDGNVPPDRWLLDRKSGHIISHTPAARNQQMMPAKRGVQLIALPETKLKQPPLDASRIQAVHHAGSTIENTFGAPQDIEWSFHGDKLILLQARPITTVVTEHRAEDKRAWYLSLHRSFEELKRLRVRIEKKLIPEMIETAEILSDQDLSSISHNDLITEIYRRREINDHWIQVYWKEFIPYAHGIRLFGQVYNDAIRPEDPYEFMRLLENTDMKSMERNRLLSDLAGMVRENEKLSQQLHSGTMPEPRSAFQLRLREFIDQFGDLSCPVTGGAECNQGSAGIIRIILEMASYPPAPHEKKIHESTEKLTQKYLSMFEGESRNEAEELLSLGRSSYRLRDDDNIYLGRIEAQLAGAVKEAAYRLENFAPSVSQEHSAAMQAVVAAYNTDPPSDAATKNPPSGRTRPVRARQLTGQPASPGIATGKARVIHKHDDLLEFTHGECLVVDAVDPNMTFVIPLSAAVVERRGGMLIHGAIIAREYGIPCVTGVPEAVSHITTGDEIVVDGFLGIVTLTAT